MTIDELKNFLARKVGGDQAFDQGTWDLLELLPEDLYPHFTEPEGGFLLEQKLQKIFEPKDIFFSANDAIEGKQSEQLKCWERVGYVFRVQGLHTEAVVIYLALYDRLLEAQDRRGERAHSGFRLLPSDISCLQ